MTWKTRVLDKTLEMSANALTPTCQSVMTELLNGRVIDLSGLEPDQVHPLHLAIVLRICYSKQTQTIGWTEALHVCNTACILWNIDANDVLYGLKYFHSY